MKKRQSHRQSPIVSHCRWLAYTTASAATALAGSHSAEAAIHYSGILDVPFRPNKDHVKTFPLDQAGDFISFQRAEVGNPFFGPGDIAYFRIFGLAPASFQANATSYRFFVYNLPRGQNISDGYFRRQPTRYPSSGGVLASGDFSFYSHWGHRGVGFVGFRFNGGSGIQYGWARVWVSGHPENAFRVLDYAYADPGEPITAGQRSSNEMVPEETDDIVPQEGSLGALALGAAGLLAWRKSRSRTARLKST
jgi:hypothetical protein